MCWYKNCKKSDLLVISWIPIQFLFKFQPLFIYYDSILGSAYKILNTMSTSTTLECLKTLDLSQTLNNYLEVASFYRQIFEIWNKCDSFTLGSKEF